MSGYIFPRHMMDSAAGGELLWDTWLAPGVRSRLSTHLGLDSVDDGRKFMGWLAGVHDVGKCTPMFQGQLRQVAGREDYIRRVLDAGLQLRDTSHHDCIRMPRRAK
jgi:CRISPR-associated endonuclease/helicase Cas3